MFGGDEDEGLYEESESDSDESPVVALWRSDPPPRAAPATPRPVRPADPGSPSLASVSGPVLLQIFSALPTDDRQRCREVCPGWLDLLCDPALWTALDIRNNLALTLPRNSWLRAASWLSGHALTKIVGNGCMFLLDSDVRTLASVNGATLREISLGTVHGHPQKENPAVQAMLAGNLSLMFANDGLIMMRMIIGWDFKAASKMAKYVAKAAPNAKLLVDLRFRSVEHAEMVLSNHVRPLCARRLDVQFAAGTRRQMTQLAFALNGVETLDGRYCFRNVSLGGGHEFIGHSSLEALSLDMAWCRPGKEPRWRRWAEEESDSDEPDEGFPRHGLDEWRMLCAALTERDPSLGPPHVRELHLQRCSLCPEALEALGGVLRGGCLKKLILDGATSELRMMSHITMRDEADDDRLFYAMPQQFIGGLLASSLTSLTLNHAHLFASPEVGEAVLAAVARVGTLQQFTWRDHPLKAAAGAAREGGSDTAGEEGPAWATATAMRIAVALAALLASNQLTDLTCREMLLGDAPLAVALAPLAAGQAPRLRKLDLRCMGGGAGAIATLTSAVAQSSLTRLQCLCTDCCGSLDFEAAAQRLEKRVERRAAQRANSSGAAGDDDEDDDGEDDEEEDGGEDDEDDGSWEEVEEAE
jgi:hypothetical protein